MPNTAAPNHQTLAALLPGNTYHYLVYTLCRALPPPLTNSPEDLARRNDAAIAQVAALCPANLAEANVAALQVAASQQALDCLRQAVQPDISFLGAEKCRAQASSMMRQAQGGLRLLLRMQAARQKIEANPEARDRAAWTEHCALNEMTEALLPQPAPATTTEPPAPPPPEPQPRPEPVAEPRANLHLSRSAGEVAARSEASEGAVRQPALSAPKQNTPVSPQGALMSRLLRRLEDPYDDLLQALIASSRATPSSASIPAAYARNE